MGQSPTLPSELLVRRLGDDDWRALRNLRLAALEDSPDAFWAELHVEAAYSREQWRGFLRAALWFVADCGGERVGVVGVLPDPEVPEERQVIGMWVAPQARRRGVADQLLAACARWARGQGLRALTLWVLEHNEPARELYCRHGYELTGESAHLPRDETKREFRMRLLLTPAD